MIWVANLLIITGIITLCSKPITRKLFSVFRTYNEENDLNPESFCVVGRSHVTQVNAHHIEVNPKLDDVLRMHPFQKIFNSSTKSFKYGLIFFGSFG